jgi:aminoglycoside 3-N-acetyltransferase
MTIMAHDLITAVDELAPADRPLMVHVSLRSFRAPIAEGADTLLDALLTRGRTVLVPAFTEPQFGLPAPAAMRPARNGVDYATYPAEPPWPEGVAYTPACELINAGLGVFPATLIKRAGAVRGRHPLNSFAAFGPLAKELIAAQSPADVYGPIRELGAREGRILLIGVGLNRMTAIHLAEQQSGRRLFLRWAKAAAGRVSIFEVGSCSEGFPRLEPVLRQYARPAVVGDSQWRAFPARQVLDAASTAIRQDQGITHCGDGDCLLCRDSIAGGPVETTPAGQFFRIRRHLCRCPTLARLLPSAQTNPTPRTIATLTDRALIGEGVRSGRWLVDDLRLVRADLDVLRAGMARSAAIADRAESALYVLQVVL